MEAVKKNIINILCGVVALIAIAALFWPIGGMYKKSQAELDGLKKDYQKASDILNAHRQLPVIPALGDADVPPEPLTEFPGPDWIKAGEAAKETVHLQSDQIKTEAIQHNVHTPIAEGLPKPGDRVFEFRKAYLKAFAEGLPQILQATMPPTQAEIDDRAKDLHDTKFEPTIYFIGGKEANRQAVEQNFKREAAELPDRLRQERAAGYKLYMDKDALTVNPALADLSRTPTPVQLWYGQLSLWVQQDVAAAIAAANKEATNVTESPIKQLVKFILPQDATIYFTGGGTTDPNAVVEAGKRDFTRSPTGRISNPMYDVIHFNLVLNVDATRMPFILQRLAAGRLITVYQVDMTSLDSKAAFDDGFVFGKAPVIQVTLQCEILFLRDWMNPYMPQEIKDLLHIVDAPTTPA